MTRRLIAWPLALAAVAWVGLRFVIPDQRLEAVVLVAFTPYAAGAAVVASVVCFGLRCKLAGLLATLSAVALVAAVVPRAVGGSEVRRDRDTLTVMASNTHLGEASPRALLSAARRSRADVVMIEELTPALVKSLDAAGFAERYPYRNLRAVDGAAGLGIFSRIALTDPTRRTVNEIGATVTVDGRPPVELHVVHPPSPRSTNAVRDWAFGLDLFPKASPDGRLRLLAGDFNATLDHGHLRRLIGSGYRDAADVVGAGLHPTWPSRGAFPPPVTIDHVLADRRIKVASFAAVGISGTDHRAVIASLSLPRRGA